MMVGANVIGNVFGLLTVKGEVPKGERRHHRRRTMICECVCGSIKIVDLQHLTLGNTRACGGKCSRDASFKEIQRKGATVHGEAGNSRRSTEYGTWACMNERCASKSSRAYKYYGGRGIKVCDRWKNDFAAFLHDMGRKPSPKHSLDRIDNDGNYEPGNCRWATAKQQTTNRRNTIFLTAFGQKKPVAVWAAETGMPYASLVARLQDGWTPEKIVSQPILKRGGRPKKHQVAA
jgi:hypothetical protein